MERAAQYNILTYIQALGLSAERTQEITQHYEEIETHLLEKEYGAWELAYPSSLYMRCIQALVRGSKEPSNNICIYHCLPWQTRFHVLYYEQLALHMEEKLISNSWGHETFDRRTLNWVTATYLNGL